MKTHALSVTLDCHEGAVVRLLGLILRRGFEVESIDMPPGQGLRKTLALTVAPLGDARIEVLKRQIERLQEVREVREVSVERREKQVRTPRFLTMAFGTPKARAFQ